MKKVKISYLFEDGAELTSIHDFEQSLTDSEVEDMVDNGDFIDFSYPSMIVGCDSEIVFI